MYLSKVIHTQYLLSVTVLFGQFSTFILIVFCLWTICCVCHYACQYVSYRSLYLDFGQFSYLFPVSLVHFMLVRILNYSRCLRFQLVFSSKATLFYFFTFTVSIIPSFFSVQCIPLMFLISMYLVSVQRRSARYLISASMFYFIPIHPLYFVSEHVSASAFALTICAGGDPHPRSVSARCLVGFWWLFTILMSSTYTANLAAFLTVTIEGSPVNSLTELAESSDLRPLVKQGSNPYTLFQVCCQFACSCVLQVTRVGLFVLVGSVISVNVFI